jgi:hypothetical protein
LALLLHRFENKNKMMEKKVDQPVVESKQQKVKRSRKKVNVLQQRFEQKMLNLTKEEAERLKLVEELALELMKFYDVTHFKYNLGFNSNYQGLCNYSNQTITLYYHFVLSSNLDSIRNTILHEIAHVLVGPGHAHREIWQNKAKELGVTWTRKYRKK